ncbi:ABC transporter permease [Paenibacillus sp. FSL W8-0186]|uniref:Glutathione ABC transporter permease n=1 Tax=Paenibacillus woosongensis TaxID=307580 RepID=A0ABQ4MUW9_9BACL|nr:ABC transporter permease [Paenibacillus woosongensis]GIP59728.1 glutathione ABC transporter permease [Paenibacillus woosongensis]
MLYVGQRIVQALVSIFGVATIIFFILRLTGDPVLLMVPQNATAEDIAVLRHALGLDQPVGLQYLQFLKQIFTADLGYSYIQNMPVLDIVMERIPYTIDLAIFALILTVIIGVPLGMITAIYKGTWIEKICMPFILVGQSMPAFWTGILLIMLFAVQLKWLPSSGAENLQSLILPAITLASLSIATVARMTRSSMLEQLGQDYVRTARSKGVGIPRMLYRHLLRNASIPIITVIGLECANLLGGSVITETIFAWPGLGQLTIQAIAARDFPLVQAVVVLGAAVYIFINLITDLIYGWIDPRIKLGRETSQ